MDASTYGKHITAGLAHIEESLTILEEGVQETISEDCALLCADTRLMLTIMELENARRHMKNRMGVLKNAE